MDAILEDGIKDYAPEVQERFRTLFAKQQEEQEQLDFRNERNALLAEIDNEINIAEDAGASTAPLRLHRQALRDATIDWVIPAHP
jgi:hypothetical protein